MKAKKAPHVKPNSGLRNPPHRIVCESPSPPLLQSRVGGRWGERGCPARPCHHAPACARAYVAEAVKGIVMTVGRHSRRGGRLCSCVRAGRGRRRRGGCRCVLSRGLCEIGRNFDTVHPDYRYKPLITIRPTDIRPYRSFRQLSGCLVFQAPQKFAA